MMSDTFAPIIKVLNGVGYSNTQVRFEVTGGHVKLTGYDYASGDSMGVVSIDLEKIDQVLAVLNGIKLITRG